MTQTHSPENRAKMRFLAEVSPLYGRTNNEFLLLADVSYLFDTGIGAKLPLILKSDFFTQDPLVQYPRIRNATHEERIRMYSALSGLSTHPDLLVPQWYVTDSLFPLAYAYGHYGILGSAFFVPPYVEYLDLALAWVSTWMNLSEKGEQITQGDFTGNLRPNSMGFDPGDSFYGETITKNTEEACTVLTAGFGAWLAPKARFLAAPFYLGTEPPSIITNEGLSKPLVKTDSLRPQPVSILQAGGVDYSEFRYTRKRAGRQTLSSTSTSRANSISNTTATTSSFSQSSSGGEYGIINLAGSDGGWQNSQMDNNNRGTSDSLNQSENRESRVTKKQSDVVLDEEMSGHQSALAYLEDLSRFIDDLHGDDARLASYLPGTMPQLKLLTREYGEYELSYENGRIKLCRLFDRTVQSQLAYHRNVNRVAGVHKNLGAWVDTYTAYTLGYQQKLIEFLQRFSLPEQAPDEDAFRFYHPAVVRIDNIQRFDPSFMPRHRPWKG